MAYELVAQTMLDFGAGRVVRPGEPVPAELAARTNIGRELARGTMILRPLSAAAQELPTVGGHDLEAYRAPGLEAPIGQLQLGVPATLPGRTPSPPAPAAKRGSKGGRR